MSSSEDQDISLSDDDILEHTDNLELEGKTLGKYNILSELGKGSYSIVWLGYSIENNKFYAIKVQHPNEYKTGIEENKFMKKLPKENYYFNNLIDEFIEKQDDKKFLCSVYDLHACNIDVILRKGDYQHGIPYDITMNIMRQLIISINYLHNKLKVYHGDIKTDNILVKGVTNKNKLLIELYNKKNFLNLYSEAKKQYGKTKLSSQKKLKIRNKIHSEIYKSILTDLEEIDICKYDIDSELINNCQISLADFGSFVEDGEYYDIQFGTRYYRSPENLLIGKSSYPNDIWALGCTFYEMLTGYILFDPDKDKKNSRDDFHLKEIELLCGDFPIEFIKSTKDYKKFFTSNGRLKCELILSNDKLDKLKKNLSEEQYNTVHNFLIKMLSIDPNKRITCSELITLF
jgi:serine/threonine protein kinase